MKNAKTPPVKKPAYHHGDLRAALVQCAVKVIHARGDLNFSLRDLAVDVGVSHVALYRHFPDKAALLNAVAGKGFELLTQSLRDAAQGFDHDPAQQLARQGAAYVTMAVRYPGHFAAMFNRQTNTAGQTHELQAVAEGAYEVLVETVARRLHATDSTNPDVQTEAVRCWALVHGLACLQLSGNLATCLGHDPRQASEAELNAFVIALLLPSPSG